MTQVWMRRAAEGGKVNAMEFLANRCEHAEPPDYQEAAHWRRRAAEAGSSEAMNRLALAYSIGKGVPKDAVQAAQWYRKAAEAGSAAGMSNLASVYLNGEGVVRDEKEARRWMKAAADHGDEYSKKWLVKHPEATTRPGTSSAHFARVGRSKIGSGGSCLNNRYQPSRIRMTASTTIQ